MQKRVSSPPSISLNQLRDSRRLKAWLKQGKTVELRERNRVIARILPVNTVPIEWDGGPVEWPDFAARAKEIFGDRIFPNAVLEERRRARYRASATASAKRSWRGQLG